MPPAAQGRPRVRDTPGQRLLQDSRADRRRGQAREYPPGGPGADSGRKQEAEAPAHARRVAGRPPAGGGGVSACPGRAGGVRGFAARGRAAPVGLRAGAVPVGFRVGVAVAAAARGGLAAALATAEQLVAELLHTAARRGGRLQLPAAFRVEGAVAEVAARLRGPGLPVGVGRLGGARGRGAVLLAAGAVPGRRRAAPSLSEDGPAAGSPVGDGPCVRGAEDCGAGVAGPADQDGVRAPGAEAAGSPVVRGPGVAEAEATGPARGRRRGRAARRCPRRRRRRPPPGRPPRRRGPSGRAAATGRSGGAAADASPCRRCARSRGPRRAIRGGALRPGAGRGPGRAERRQRLLLAGQFAGRSGRRGAGRAYILQCLREAFGLQPYVVIVGDDRLTPQQSLRRLRVEPPIPLVGHHMSFCVRTRECVTARRTIGAAHRPPPAAPAGAARRSAAHRSGRRRPGARRAA